MITKEMLDKDVGMNLLQLLGGSFASCHARKASVDISSMDEPGGSFLCRCVYFRNIFCTDIICSISQSINFTASFITKMNPINVRFM